MLCQWLIQENTDRRAANLDHEAENAGSMCFPSPNYTSIFLDVRREMDSSSSLFWDTPARVLYRFGSCFWGR